MKQILTKIFFDKSFYKYRLIVGGLLIALGVILFFESSPLIQMISIALIILGTFIIIMVIGKTITKNDTEALIIFGIITWVILTIFITFIQKFNIEIFIILIFIGVLVIKELFSEYFTQKIKSKIKLIILLFLIVFIIIIIKKIIDIASM